MQSILWYDLETWNASTRSARIAQFAAIRTDLDFNPIEEPIIYHCSPAKDCIPSPYAVLVHQLLPHKLPAHNTLNELTLLKRIQQLMQQPETIVSGYNNTRFDNEVLRFSWFRNGLDAYNIDYKEDNRWDIIDTVRACHALRSEGINWQKNEDNATSFKLEILAQANQLNQQQAHDALSDVCATIDMAKLVHNKQPKLYDFFFAHRDKSKLLKLLALDQASVYHQQTAPPPMLVHISGMVPDEQRRAEVIMPIAFHPSYKNEVIAIGLKQDPTELLDLSVEDIRHRVFSKKEVLEQAQQQRLRIFTLRLKKIPAIAPLKVLQSPQQWQAIGHNQQQCEHHYQLVLQHFDTINEKLLQLYQSSAEENNVHNADVDVDLSLYQKFLSRKDKRLLNQFHQHINQEDEDFSTLNFDNPNLQQIIFRTRARNLPHTLTQQEQNVWQQHCQKVYQDGNATEYSLQNCRQDIDDLRNTELTLEQAQLLDEFEQWLTQHIALSSRPFV